MLNYIYQVPPYIVDFKATHNATKRMFRCRSRLLVSCWLWHQRFEVTHQVVLSCSPHDCLGDDEGCQTSTGLSFNKTGPISQVSHMKNWPNFNHCYRYSFYKSYLVYPLWGTTSHLRRPWEVVFKRRWYFSGVVFKWRWSLKGGSTVVKN